LLSTISGLRKEGKVMKMFIFEKIAQLSSALCSVRAQSAQPVQTALAVYCAVIITSPNQY
jgi:hypothetical protein